MLQAILTPNTFLTHLQMVPICFKIENIDFIVKTIGDVYNNNSMRVPKLCKVLANKVSRL